MKKLITLQKNVIRNVAHAQPRDHTNDFFKSLNLMKLSDIINLNMATFVYRSCNNMLPNSFNQFFTTNSSFHDHYTRQCNNLHTMKCRNNTIRNCLRYRAATFWNSLPDHHKSIDHPLKHLGMHCNVIL